MSDDLYPRNRRTGAFERRIARALASALPPEARVVVACSGGPDSSAALVATVRALGASRVTAACFDHRLRPPAEVARERTVVDAVAGRLGVSVRHGRPPRRPSDASEAAAREARYRWLARVCRDAGAVAVVTGHTRDDQAETVLLRIVRGAGAAGIAGMEPVAPWPVALPRGVRAPALLRPLLDEPRTEVEAYLRALDIEAAEDPSNASFAYARNVVRHRVLPVLRELNPQADAAIVAFASKQREDDAALLEQADAWLATHPPVREPGAIGLDRLALRRLPAAVAARVLRSVGASAGVTLEGAHVEAILKLAGRSSGSVSLPLAHMRSAGTMIWLRERPPTSGRTGYGPGPSSRGT